jgi:hypothetical protein
MPNREKSQAVFDRAMNVLSKDVSSNFRYWGPDSTPVLMPDKCFGMENNICTGDLVLLTIKELVNEFLFK